MDQHTTVLSMYSNGNIYLSRDSNAFSGGFTDRDGDGVYDFDKSYYRSEEGEILHYIPHTPLLKEPQNLNNSEPYHQSDYNISYADMSSYFYSFYNDMLSYYKEKVSSYTNYDGADIYAKVKVQNHELDSANNMVLQRSGNSDPEKSSIQEHGVSIDPTLADTNMLPSSQPVGVPGGGVGRVQNTTSSSSGASNWNYSTGSDSELQFPFDPHGNTTEDSALGRNSINNFSESDMDVDLENAPPAQQNPNNLQRVPSSELPSNYSDSDINLNPNTGSSANNLSESDLEINLESDSVASDFDSAPNSSSTPELSSDLQRVPSSRLPSISEEDFSQLNSIQSQDEANPIDWESHGARPRNSIPRVNNNQYEVRNPNRDLIGRGYETDVEEEASNYNYEGDFQYDNPAFDESYFISDIDNSEGIISGLDSSEDIITVPNIDTVPNTETIHAVEEYPATLDELESYGANVEETEGVASLLTIIPL